MPRFGQVITAMVTPFHKDGSLNLDGAKRLARWLQDNGNDGLVLAGTTGEAPVLTDDERLSLFKAVVESVTIPVIAGTGTNDTAHSIHMTKEASKLGVAGILAVTPYYNRPSQAGIEAHMRAVCGATDLPVVIYDIPVRTGRKINTPTLAKLANEVKNVAGVKDAAGNPAESARLMTMVPKSFELISGDDGLTLPLMAVGCTAVIGVATHWSGVDHQEMFTKWNAGDTAGARAVNARLVESFAFETGDDNPNPLPTKAMMNHLGLDVGEARLPMGPPPAGLSERAAHVMKNLVAARG
ncbi:MAG: 4-hydroxy-tetrahydrodipicolinate synthase [Actinobacteria bacterium]|nr:4-hydroxy-tetrahydrodipicolinate synthase [Actinomycetota bacterium]